MSIDLFWLLGLSAAVVLGLRYLWRGIRAAYGGPFPLKRRPLLTGNEREFYARLNAACQGDFIVMAQVAMAAIVDLDEPLSTPGYWEKRDKFSRKIIDFVLCDPRTLAPVLIVELDDRMHDFKKDRARDELLAIAGYRTLRLWSRDKPEPVELRRKILAQVPARA